MESKLNPASLLPDPVSAVLIHDCAEIIDEVYSSRIDLKESECVSGRKEDYELPIKGKLNMQQKF